MRYKSTWQTLPKVKFDLNHKATRGNFNIHHYLSLILFFAFHLNQSCENSVRNYILPCYYALTYWNWIPADDYKKYNQINPQTSSAFTRGTVNGQQALRPKDIWLAFDITFFISTYLFIVLLMQRPSTYLHFKSQ